METQKKQSVPTNTKTAEHAKDKKSVASVIPLPTKKTVERVVGKTKIRPQRLRRYMLAVSAVLCVLIPTLLASVYFIFIASDRYAASAGFSVRSMDSASAGIDFLGALSGLSGSTSTATDSYILLEYMKSRELVEKLQNEIAFQEAYGSDKVDFLYRLEPNQPIEDVVKYWEWMITTSYDNSTDIIQFEVQAFSAEDAEKVAALIVKYNQELINKLSLSARNDAVLFAKREVAAAELRLRQVREELRVFRAKSNALDPAATATATLSIITELEGQLIEQQAQLATLRASLSENSPSIQQTKKRIAALQQELKNKQSEISGAGILNSEDKANLPNILADFERLRVEQEFSQQAYTVALASLERSRAEADRQQRFLAVFRKPTTPQDAIYPQRILNIFLVFIICAILWGIGTLLVYSVRDHMK